MCSLKQRQPVHILLIRGLDVLDVFFIYKIPKPLVLIILYGEIDRGIAVFYK